MQQMFFNSTNWFPNTFQLVLDSSRMSYEPYEDPKDCYTNVKIALGLVGKSFGCVNIERKNISIAADIVEVILSTKWSESGILKTFYSTISQTINRTQN